MIRFETDKSSPPVKAVVDPVALQAQILKDIVARWDKFSEDDLAGLKTADDLVKLIVTVYGAKKPQTKRDVTEVLAGRKFQG